MNIYEMTPEQYQQKFLDEGEDFIERILGKGAPKNIAQFKSEQAKYEASECVFWLIMNTAECNADPAELYDLYEEHKERIVEALQWFERPELLDKRSIISQVEERL